MSNSSVNQYYLFNSNKGYIKIIEFNAVEESIYIWSISKRYTYCTSCMHFNKINGCPYSENCPVLEEHKNEVQDPDFYKTGDFDEFIAEPFHFINDYVNYCLAPEYPDYRLIPLGCFTGIEKCRSYLEYIKASLNGCIIYN